MKALSKQKQKKRVFKSLSKFKVANFQSRFNQKKVFVQMKISCSYFKEKSEMLIYVNFMCSFTFALITISW